jgi:hypothetical protein
VKKAALTVCVCFFKAALTLRPLKMCVSSNDICPNFLLIKNYWFSSFISEFRMKSRFESCTFFISLITWNFSRDVLFESPLLLSVHAMVGFGVVETFDWQSNRADALLWYSHPKKVTLCVCNCFCRPEPTRTLRETCVFASVCFLLFCSGHDS